MANEHTPTCPHCREALERWEPNPYTGWGHDLYFCNNNECDYFVTGRRRICEEFEKNFAYRYCLDPRKNKELPLIAWCPGELSLLKGRCAEAEHRCEATG
jgi:hypothetical protein